MPHDPPPRLSPPHALPPLPRRFANPLPSPSPYSFGTASLVPSHHGILFFKHHSSSDPLPLPPYLEVTGFLPPPLAFPHLMTLAAACPIAPCSLGFSSPLSPP